MKRIAEVIIWCLTLLLFSYVTFAGVVLYRNDTHFYATKICGKKRHIIEKDACMIDYYDCVKKFKHNIDFCVERIKNDKEI